VGSYRDHDFDARVRRALSEVLSAVAETEEAERERLAPARYETARNPQKTSDDALPLAEAVVELLQMARQRFGTLELLRDCLFAQCQEVVFVSLTAVEINGQPIQAGRDGMQRGCGPEPEWSHASRAVAYRIVSELWDKGVCEHQLGLSRGVLTPRLCGARPLELSCANKEVVDEGFALVIYSRQCMDVAVPYSAPSLARVRAALTTRERHTLNVHEMKILHAHQESIGLLLVVPPHASMLANCARLRAVSGCDAAWNEKQLYFVAAALRPALLFCTEQRRSQICAACGRAIVALPGTYAPRIRTGGNA
jgi:hypothetical protein